MNISQWLPYAAIAIILACVLEAKWSVYAMAQQLNTELSPQQRISLKWWPGYKDRHVLRLYSASHRGSALPKLYIAGIVAAIATVFVTAIVMSKFAS